MAGRVGPLHLYRRYLGVSMRSQMQYKKSFLLQSLGHFIGTGIEFVGLWALFQRFGNLRGWVLEEAAFFYGFVHITFAVADATGRGFDVFPQIVKSGDFDRVLLRPRTTVLQIMGHELTLRRVGRFLQGLLVLLWAVLRLQLDWNLPRILLLAGAMLGGVLLFQGLYVLQATLAFWTIETLEIMNIMTYGGVETTQYPMSIYRPLLRRFFTFVIPLATFSYFPIVTILQHRDPLGAPAWVGWLSPAVGALFFAASLRLWRYGIRHYTSTGS